MKHRKIWRIALVAVTVLCSLVSCSNDPEWADPEAHERTEQLREQYAPLFVGTWHVERMTERMRYFERLTFNDDGTFSGLRKWQVRRLVTVEGKEVFTDWEDMDGLVGAFSGTWKLRWERSDDGAGGSNRLLLHAPMNEGNWMAYSTSVLFDMTDADALRLSGNYLGYVADDEEGWVTFLRGDAEPGF